MCSSSCAPPRFHTSSQEAEASFKIVIESDVILGMGIVVPQASDTPQIFPGQLLIHIIIKGRYQLLGFYPSQLRSAY